MPNSRATGRSLPDFARVAADDTAVTLLALLRFTKDQPIAMLPPRVVGLFPSRVGNRAFSHFDDAIAGTESHLGRSLNEADMRPLIAVAVNVIGDLT